MAPDFPIPTVTEADLLNFHLRVYGKSFQPPDATEGESLEEQDDGLGFYEDGVKRTLTDEQIAIFRHSEIHALRQQQRRLADHQALIAAENVSTSPQADSGELVPNTESIALHDLSDAVDEDEYAQFLEQERIEFEQAASQQRKRSQHQQDGDYRDRTVSTRRRVREMDAMNTSEQILDYDEGFTAEASRETGDEARKILEKPQGKRIWWPEIRPLP